MAFRDRVLQRLQANGLTEESLADQLTDVIKGVRRTRKFGYRSDGERVLLNEEETSTPQDAAKGLLILDTLMGGELGLVPKSIEQVKPQDRLYASFAPAKDDRIIARPRLVTAEVASVPEVLSPEPTPMNKVGDLLREKPARDRDSDEF